MRIDILEKITFITNCVTCCACILMVLVHYYCDEVRLSGEYFKAVFIFALTAWASLRVESSLEGHIENPHVLEVATFLSLVVCFFAGLSFLVFAIYIEGSPKLFELILQLQS